MPGVVQTRYATLTMTRVTVIDFILRFLDLFFLKLFCNRTLIVVIVQIRMIGYGIRISKLIYNDKSIMYNKFVKLKKHSGIPFKSVFLKRTKV